MSLILSDRLPLYRSDQRDPASRSAWETGRMGRASRAYICVCRSLLELVKLVELVGPFPKTRPTAEMRNCIETLNVTSSNSQILIHFKYNKRPSLITSNINGFFSKYEMKIENKNIVCTTERLTQLFERQSHHFCRESRRGMRNSAIFLSERAAVSAISGQGQGWSD